MTIKQPSLEFLEMHILTKIVLIGTLLTVLASNSYAEEVYVELKDFNEVMQQRYFVMYYLCKQDPILCKQRQWLKPFENLKRLEEY